MAESDILQSYRDIPEEERKKAEVFFERGRTVADTGNYEYAIEMYLQGLNIDPESVPAHQAIREISLKRKASGGKDLGIFQKMKLRRGGKDEKQTLLNAEKMLAYDPGNTDHMLTILQSAWRAGFYDTVLWVGPILQRANADSKSPNFNKFITLKNIYADLRQWKLATEACHHAAQLRPDDMELQTEMKNLAAQHTMDEGKYAAGGSFRGSVRDALRQQKLMESDKDIRSMDSLTRAIQEAEAEYQADPEEPSKLMRLVEALVRTEREEYENRAIELLQEAFERTKQFRFRHNIGRIKLAQLTREDRARRAELATDPNDEQLRKQYAEWVKRRAEQELEEYTLWSHNYPTDMGFRYQMAVRMFQLGQYNDAITVFQQARADPKYRVEAGTLLGRAFLQAGYVDEAVETLKVVIDEYQIRGDTRSKDMYYWYGRALQHRDENQAALKSYSQVAQWDFNYRDVQARIKALRGGGDARPTAD